MCVRKWAASSKSACLKKAARSRPGRRFTDAVYLANLESARAQLATAQAALAKADADLTRYKPLVAASVISQQEYDAAVASRQSAQASVKAANAVELFGMPDIDGGLIGGASLNADEFGAICRAAGN